MTNSAAVYVRIDPELKKDAEAVLDELGMSPSTLIKMMYKQIVLTQSVPLNLSLPANKPVAMGALTQEELNQELTKGIDSLKYGTYTQEEVDAILHKEFGL
jgi:addiction module RelB/DinJ family antitoxin